MTGKLVVFALLFKHDISVQMVNTKGKFYHPEAILWSVDTEYGVWQRCFHSFGIKGHVFVQ